MKKKILYIIQLPPPVHGVSIMNSIVYNSEIINLGLSKSLLRLDFNKRIEDIQKFTIVKILQFIRLLTKLFWKLLTNRPSYAYFTIVPTGKGFYRDFISVLFLKIFHIPVIFHLHGKGIKQRTETNGMLRVLYKFTFSGSKVIHLSRRLIEMELTALKLSDQNVFSVSNGIPLNPLVTNDLLHRDYEKNTFPNIAYLSSFTSSKGIYILLDALSVIKKRVAFTVSLIGQPYDITVDDLIRKNRELDLSDLVSIFSVSSENEKYKHLLSADIFVHPTLNDAFPLVILEAMQCALPVISTVEGAISEIVDDSITGFLVPKNDAPALSEKIEILVKDSLLRKKMGDAGREKFLNEFTVDRFERNMKSVFVKIMQ